MSDSDYYTSDSDSENSDVEVKPLNKTPLFKPSSNIKTYNNELSDSEESELDDADNDDDKENKIGGGKEDRSDDENSLEKEDDSEVESDDETSDIEVDEEGNQIEDNKTSKTIKKKKVQIMVDDDDDDDDEYEENYLQKFDSEISKNYIDEFHPECLSHNYDEITKLSHVVRNSEGIIVDPLHKTIPYLTKYEKARILGQRAKQIETGSKPLVKVPENIVDGYIIAELELREKKIPFIIKRPIPGGACEYWNLNDLENIGF